MRLPSSHKKFIPSYYYYYYNYYYYYYYVRSGVGFGLMYLPSIIVVGYYFDERRALATGIAVCGSSIGAFVFAPLMSWLLSLYGWRGANFVIAGVILNGLICGSVYRPIANAKQVYTLFQKKTLTFDFDIRRYLCEILTDLINFTIVKRAIYSGFHHTLVMFLHCLVKMQVWGLHVNEKWRKMQK